MRNTSSGSSRDGLDELNKLAGEFAVATADGTSHDCLLAISKLLRRVREVFCMDVVFVSEFTGGQRVFRHVDCSEASAGMAVEGAAVPLEESYCQWVLDGRLPRAIPDAGAIEAAGTLAATRELEIGAHLSVPIILHGGQTYGTLCCFSRRPQPGLADADAQALASIADLIAAGIDRFGRMRTPLLVKDVPSAGA